MDNKILTELQNTGYSGGVPVLKREQIETIAEIVNGTQDNRIVPIDIERVMEKDFNLTLDFQSLHPEGIILGETIFYQCCREVFHYEGSVKKELISVHEGTVLIEEGLPMMEARYRFTLAHELGHWVLHQNFYNTTTNRACRSYRKQQIISSHYQAKSPIEWTEWQADTFAGAILMPRSAMRESLKQFLKDNALSWKELSNFSDNRSREYYVDFLADVARTYKVSKEAARIRMNKLCRMSFPD